MRSLKALRLTPPITKLLEDKSDPSVIERALRGKRSPRARGATADCITVAAVQMELNLLDDGAQYAEKIYGLCRQAVERGAQLVAFPEYAWTPLIGMLPGVQALASESKNGGGLSGALKEISGSASLKATFALVARPVETAFVAAGRAVARELGIYLMSGSTIARDEAEHLYNVAYLFGTDGSLIGSQKKLHAYTTEREWLTVGSSLQVFELPFTRVALPVCMDFTYWETTRLAWRDGAEIFFNPSADSAGDQEFLAARGVQTRVQESPAYGLLCNMVTDLFGLHWRGPSRIVEPIGMPARGSVLAQTASNDREEIIVQELDLVSLREFRATHAPDFNRPLYRKYLPQAYAQYRERAARDGKRTVK